MTILDIEQLKSIILNKNIVIKDDGIYVPHWVVKKYLKLATKTTHHFSLLRRLKPKKIKEPGSATLYNLTDLLNKIATKQLKQEVNSEL